MEFLLDSNSILALISSISLWCLSRSSTGKMFTTMISMASKLNFKSFLWFIYGVELTELPRFMRNQNWSYEITEKYCGYLEDVNYR